MKTIVIDIDGTICDETRLFDKWNASPMPKAIELVNKLYNEGNIIILFTARHWHMFDMTAAWLKRHNVQYNSLVCGKPAGDYYIDDRSFKSVESFIKEEKPELI